MTSQRIAWLTDIHLNFVPPWVVQRLLEEIAAEDPVAVLITGDIAEAVDVAHFLQQMHKRLACPIYFVLGNHDFYHGSIDAVRNRVSQLQADHPRLHYLTVTGCHRITPHVSLVGHDGWADGELGDYSRSLIEMMDNRLIEELRGKGKYERRQVMRRLADAATERLEAELRLALRETRYVWLATHVPPFREACWYAGRLSDDQWAPHFTSHRLGQMLLHVMRSAPDARLTVYCGHTHGAGDVWIRTNLRVVTGAAEYGHPGVTRWLTLPREN